jgi:hypothetical protein
MKIALENLRARTVAPGNIAGRIKAAVNAPQSRRFATSLRLGTARSVWTAVALAPL